MEPAPVFPRPRYKANHNTEAVLSNPQPPARKDHSGLTTRLRCCNTHRSGAGADRPNPTGAAATTRVVVIGQSSLDKGLEPEGPRSLYLRVAIVGPLSRAPSASLRDFASLNPGQRPNDGRLASERERGRTGSGSFSRGVGFRCRPAVPLRARFCRCRPAVLFGLHCRRRFHSGRDSVAVGQRFFSGFHCRRRFSRPFVHSTCRGLL